MVRLIATQATLNGPGFAKLFFQHIYPHYGLLISICSDRGVQWNNKFFKSLSSELGFSLHLTFSYHPCANGQVERLNRVIEEAACHFVGPSHDDWDGLLPHLEFSITPPKPMLPVAHPSSLIGSRPHCRQRPLLSTCHSMPDHRQLSYTRCPIHWRKDR